MNVDALTPNITHKDALTPKTADNAEHACAKTQTFMSDCGVLGKKGQ